MAVYTIGGAIPNAPFNRTFFNVTLGDLLDPAGGEARLTLFLIDGATLEVCEIHGLYDQYVSVRAARAGNDACDLRLHLIPYNVIYRVEIAPREAAEDARVGFHWNPAGTDGKKTVRAPETRRRGKRSSR